MVGVAVQADPVGRGGSARGSGVEGVGDGLGQVLEPGGQVQVGVKPGLVEPFVEGVDLAAQVSDLYGQGGQALAQSAGRRVSGRVRGHGCLPSSLGVQVAAGGARLQPRLWGQFGGDPASSAAVPVVRMIAVQGKARRLTGNNQPPESSSQPPSAAWLRGLRVTCLNYDG